MYNAGTVNTAPATTEPSTPPIPVDDHILQQARASPIKTGKANCKNGNRNRRFHHLPDFQSRIGGSDCKDDAEENAPADRTCRQLRHVRRCHHDRRIDYPGLQGWYAFSSRDLVSTSSMDERASWGRAYGPSSSPYCGPPERGRYYSSVSQAQGAEAQQGHRSHDEGTLEFPHRSPRSIHRPLRRGLRVGNHASHGLLPSPPAKRTDHLLSQPDISCANDTSRSEMFLASEDVRFW